MDSAEFHKAVLTQLMTGAWTNLMPVDVLASFRQWLSSRTTDVVVRFVFRQPDKERYAVYLLCGNKPRPNSKIFVKDYSLADEAFPLSLPIEMYELPLFCMPEDVFKNTKI